MTGKLSDQDVARAAAEFARHAGSADGLRISVIDPGSADPMVVVEEQERFLRVHAHDLRLWIEARRVGTDTADVTRLLARWVAVRAVCNREAERSGVATVDVDADGRLGWRVRVPRDDGGTVQWSPSAGCRPADRDAARALAVDRATSVRARMWAEGTVAVWRHEDRPALTSAVCVNPERMLAQMASEGLRCDDPYAVVAPGVHGTVAVGPQALARRLAAGIPDRQVVAPLNDLDGMGWL